MKLNEIFKHTFKALSPKPSDISRMVDFILPSMPMVQACRADDFDFFQPWIDMGKLTVEQMHHAAARYYLGKSKSDHPIFWLIDDMLTPQDALIYPNTWISTLLKQREPILQSCHVRHCLFGLHLLNESYLADSGRISRVATPKSIGLVESPESAVILSELYPNQLWLSLMPHTCFTIDQLKPLLGCKVTVYPHTDETGSNFIAWLELRDMARRTFGLDIAVSNALEDAASADQKHREIDMLQYLLERWSQNSATKPIE